MPTTDTSEKGLESLIVSALTGKGASDATDASGAVRDERALYGGYVQGASQDFDRGYAVDRAKLLDFLRATQAEIVQQLGLGEDGPRRSKFLARLQGEVARRGVIDVLRKGVSHLSAHVDLFYGTPTPGNQKAAERFAGNVFSVTGMCQ